MGKRPSLPCTLWRKFLGGRSVESIFIDVATVIAAVAAFLRANRTNPEITALEDAIALAIIADILEQTAEPLGQPELIETFRTLAREATASSTANERLANMKPERIWFLASQVRVRGADRVSLTDGGALR